MIARQKQNTYQRYFFPFSCWIYGKYILFLLKTDRGMKIVYIYDAIARIGGVERALADKMNYLAEVYGHEIHLLTSSQGNHPFSFPLSGSINHTDINVRFHTQYRYGYPKRFWIKWKLDKEFGKKLKEQVTLINPDILVGTTYYKADDICRLPCRAAKIIESHCARPHTGINDGVKRNLFTQIIHRCLLKRRNRLIETRSDAIVSLTRADSRNWNKDEKCKFVIPNFIKNRPQPSKECTRPRVVSAGRLVYEKGFDRLIRSWSIVHEKYPGWQLDIYGEGKEKENLTHLIQSLKLEKCITLHPFTDRIFQEYADSSIYALPSHYEGFGLVLIEAMSCGIPCVAFDCPYGPSEIIRDKENGLLIRNGDIKGFANAVVCLIDRVEIRKEYGRKAREDAKSFLTENVMPQWNNLFNRMI